MLARLLELRRSLSLGQVTSNWVVVSACTILETAAAELLEEQLRTRKAATQSQLERRFIQEFSREINDSWFARLDWLSRGFAVVLENDLKDLLLALIELRNAIAHNGQEFTARQTANYDGLVKTKRILEKHFSVQFYGNALVITPSTGDAAVTIARQVASALFR